MEFINELGFHVHCVGRDVWKIMKVWGMKMDER